MAAAHPNSFLKKDYEGHSKIPQTLGGMLDFILSLCYPVVMNEDKENDIMEEIEMADAIDDYFEQQLINQRGVIDG